MENHQPATELDTKTDNVDACLVTVIDGAVENYEEYFLRDGEEKILFGAIKLINEKKMDTKLSADPNHILNILRSFNKRKYDKYVHVPFKRDYDNFRRYYGTEIADIILDGKIKVLHLINSPGGSGVIMDRLLEAGKHVIDRGGNVEAFVTGEAASAAAILFGHAQRRYCLQNSSFMWHLSSNASSEGESALEKQVNKYEADAQMSAIYSFFLQHARSACFSTIEGKIKKAEEDPNNNDNQIWFTARELESYGVVHKTFSSYFALQKKFIESTEQRGAACMPSLTKFFVDPACPQESRLWQKILFGCAPKKPQRGT